MSKLQEALERGEFAVTAEMAPPKGTDLSHLLECAKMCVGRVHAANVTDFQSAVMRATSLATCKLLKDIDQLDNLLEIRPMKDYSKQNNPRSLNLKEKQNQKTTAKA